MRDDPVGSLGVARAIHYLGKVLIQDMWREGTAWNEQISEDINAKWLRWVINYIAEIRMPRCNFRNADQDTYQNSEHHMYEEKMENRSVV